MIRRRASGRNHATRQPGTSRLPVVPTDAERTAMQRASPANPMVPPAGLPGALVLWAVVPLMPAYWMVWKSWQAPAASWPVGNATAAH